MMHRSNPETVSLDDILITEELMRRSPRFPDWQAEAQAMRSLAQQIVNAPNVMLQSLVKLAVELCQAGSAGVSLLEAIDGAEIFCWTALAGQLAQHIGGTTPRNFSPCGVCLDRRTPVLFSRPERYFTDLQVAGVPVVECLVLPLALNDQPLGTIWIVSHDKQRQFDAEDVRVVRSLVDFAAALLLNQRQTIELVAKNAQLEAEAIERQQSEVALRESEERLRLATEAAQMYAWEFDLLTQTPKFSANYERVTGLQPLSSFEENLQHVHPDDRAIVTEAFAQAIVSGDRFDYEMRVFNAEQQIDWYRVFGVIRRDFNQQPHRAVGIAQNITEAKHRQAQQQQAAAALDQAQKRLELSITGAKLGTWTYNVRADQFWADDRAQQMHGHDWHEACRFQEAGAHIHPDDLDRAQAFTEAIQTQSNLQIDYRVVWPDNSIHWVASYAEFLATGDEEGMFYGITQDISDRKFAEAALRESEARLRTLIENLPGGAVFVVDRHLRYLLAGGEALAIAGFKPETFVGQTIFEVLPPNMAATYETLYRRALAGEAFEHEHDAHDRSFISRGIPLRSENGVDAVLAVSYDITDRKQAEAALRQSEAKYRSLFASIDEGYALCELIYDDSETPIDWKVLEVNPAFEGLTGLCHAAGKRGSELNQSINANWLQTFSSVAQTGKAIRFEQSVSSADAWFEISASRIDADSRQIIVVFNNITERKQAEANRIQLIQEQADRLKAERISQMKDEFLAMISHELQSPMVAILGWTRLLRSHLPPPALLTQHLATIERNATLQAKLIQDLLDISRITAGKLRLIPKPVTLESILESAIAAIETDAIAKTIDLRYPTLDQASTWVMGDRDRLQQVIGNLLKNAIQFTPDGGCVEIRLEGKAGGRRQRAKGSEPPAFARLTISDTGIGIAPDLLPHVFDRFRQAPDTVRGMGLGLAIAQHLVELHEGTISAHSAGEGQGATFIVRLPLLSAIEPTLP